MGKIKNILVYIVGALLILGSIGLFDNLIGKRYQKFYPNQHSSSYAVKEFKSICPNAGAPESDERGTEYHKFYDKRSEALNSFMLLVHRLNNQYANGKFHHLYIGKERIYQCYNKDKKLIAVRLSRCTGGFWLGYGGGFDEMKPFYEIQFYVER